MRLDLNVAVCQTDGVACFIQSNDFDQYSCGCTDSFLQQHCMPSLTACFQFARILSLITLYQGLQFIKALAADAVFSQVLFHVMNIMPTDPGMK